MIFLNIRKLLKNRSADDKEKEIKTHLPSSLKYTHYVMLVLSTVLKNYYFQEHYDYKMPCGVVQ